MSFYNCITWTTLILDLEEKAKQEEIEEKQKTSNPGEAQSGDTSEKANNAKTQDKDKNNTDSSEKLQDKGKKDTRHDKGTNEKDSKTQDDSGKAEPAELQPREQEGNKDPGGANDARTPGSDAKEPETTSSDTDNSQRAQNGEWQRSIRYDLLKRLHNFYYILYCSTAAR